MGQHQPAAVQPGYGKQKAGKGPKGKKQRRLLEARRLKQQRMEAMKFRPPHKDKEEA